jgi:hypothetical protein
MIRNEQSTGGLKLMSVMKLRGMDLVNGCSLKKY